MTRTRRIALAVALSFVVQVIPLFNVHAGWFPLAVMWGGLADPSPFILGSIAGGLVIQFFAGLLIYALLGDWRWWKALILLAAVPVFGVASNIILLWLVPLVVLVGNDPAPETGELIEVCGAPDTTLAQVRTGSDLAMERAGQAIVILKRGRDRGLLAMPDCRVAAFDMEWNGGTVHPAAVGGVMVESAGGEAVRYWKPGMAAPEEIAAPDGTRYWNPILSDDGGALVWIARRTSEGGALTYIIKTLDLHSRRGKSLPLAIEFKDALKPLGADLVRGQFITTRRPQELLVFDRDGRQIGATITVPQVQSIYDEFRRFEGGWVVWDSYREEGRSHIAWSLDGQARGIDLPRGRDINSFAVDPAGRYFAVSQQSGVSIGNTPDAVFVVDMRTGHEVYRRIFPRFSRPRLAFLGPGLLAISKNEEGRAWTRVYRLKAE